MPVLTRKIFAIFLIILNHINAYFEFLIDIRVNTHFFIDPYFIEKIFFIQREFNHREHVENVRSVI